MKKLILKMRYCINGKSKNAEKSFTVDDELYSYMKELASQFIDQEGENAKDGALTRDYIVAFDQAFGLYCFPQLYDEVEYWGLEDYRQCPESKSLPESEWDESYEFEIPVRQFGMDGGMNFNEFLGALSNLGIQVTPDND